MVKRLNSGSVRGMYFAEEVDLSELYCSLKIRVVSYPRAKIPSVK